MRRSRNMQDRGSGAGICVPKPPFNQYDQEVSSMITKLATAAGILCLSVLILSACVSQQDYDVAVAQNQQLKAQLAALQAQQKYVEAADLLFPSGGFQLTPAGQAELANNIVPKLKGLQNAKIVVYGYTDNTPVGPEL